jgi:flagellar biogenesis protein FliO
LAVTLLTATCLATPTTTPTESKPLTSEHQPLGPARASTTPAQPPRAKASIASTLGPLAGVVGLIVAAAWGFKRFARRSGSLTFGAVGKSPAGIVSILGRYPISRGMSLVLLRVDRRVLVLAQTAGRSPSMSTLCEISGEDDVASILAKAMSSDGAAAAFRGMVSRAQHDLDNDPSLIDGPLPPAPARASLDFISLADPAPQPDATPRPTSLRDALASMLAGKNKGIKA